MNISDIGTGQALYQMAAQRSYSPPVGSTTVTPEDEGDGFQQSQESDKFKAIVSNYDLTDISGSDLTKMGEELYNKHLITAEEKQTFTSAADCPLKKLNVQHGADGDFVSEADAEHPENVKMDYVKQWSECKADISANESDEGKKLAANADKVLNLFEKIGFYQQSEE